MIDWPRVWRPATGPMLMLVALLASCQTARLTAGAATETIVPADWACLVFLPVTWSSRDTQDTVTQIWAHNAVWESVCGQMQ